MSNTIKKISSLSIIVMLIGGTIGAGIFYKNQELLSLAQGKFGIVLATWGVGIVGMLALAAALVELTTAQKSDRGILEWTRLFTPKWFHKSSANFTKWFYVPIMFFAVPLLTAQSLEEVFHKSGNDMPFHSSWVALIIAVSIFLWLSFTNLLSLKFSEISQWVFTVLQTIPLVVLPIIGFIHWGEMGDATSTIMTKTMPVPAGLDGVTPYLTFVGGIAAIAFAYSGFYAASSLRNQMEKPNQLGAAQLIGVAIVSIIYLIVSFGFNVAGDGTHEGLAKWINPTVFRLIRVCITIGIIAIINNMLMATPFQFGSLISSGDANDVSWVQKLVFRGRYDAESKRQRYIGAWVYINSITMGLFLILGVVGAAAYSAPDSFGHTYLGGRDLYSFANTIINFTSLFIFAIIVTCILGGLVNRRTNKVETTKSKYFIPAAWVSMIVMYAGLAYTIIKEIVNATGFRAPENTAAMPNAHNEFVTSSIINLAIYLAVFAFSVIPAVISVKKENGTLAQDHFDTKTA